MTLVSISVLILGLCITTCLVAIGIFDMRTRLIRNKALLVLLIPVLLSVLVIHRFSVYGLYGFIALSLLSLFIFATKQWGAGDTKLVVILALLLLVMPAALQVWEAVYAFISLLCLGLGATYIYSKISKTAQGALPGGLALVLPGTALWVVLLSSYH